MERSYRALTGINLILSGFFIALAFDFPEMIVRFLLVGELPDRTTLLSPDVMLVITGACIITTLLIFIPRLSMGVVAKTLSIAPKVRLPHHRYTSL